MHSCQRWLTLGLTILYDNMSSFGGSKSKSYFFLSKLIQQINVYFN